MVFANFILSGADGLAQLFFRFSKLRFFEKNGLLLEGGGALQNEEKILEPAAHGMGAPKDLG